MKSIVCLLGLSALILLCACEDKSASSKQFTIGFSQCIASDAWRQQMLEEMQLELILHPDIELRYKDADGSNSRQVNDVRQLLREGIDLLIISPNEAAPLTGIVDSVYDLGIPVILVDRKTISPKFTTYIGADNREVGQLAADRAITLLNGAGNILEITGLKGSTPSQDRRDGFREAISDSPHIKIIKEIDGAWLPSVARDALETQGSTLDSVDLVFAHNDQMGKVAKEVFKSVGREIKVIGVDGLPGQENGIAMVNDGILNATVLYPTGGQQSIELASKLLNGAPVERELILNSTLIDLRNSRVMEQQQLEIQEQVRSSRRLEQRIQEQLALYQSQQTMIYILIAALVVFGVLIVTLFFVYRIVKRQKETIEKQKQDLEALNIAKNKFFSIVSHDLRAPLSSLKGYSSLLVQHLDRLTKEEIFKMGNELSVSVDNTIKMAENLITWARIQMNELTVKQEPFKVRELADFICNVYKPVAAQKNVTFECDEGDYTILGNKDQIAFVLRNLVNNAIKFTPDGGVVRLTAEVGKNDTVKINVADTGIGMTEEQRKKLFSLQKNGSKGTAGELGTGLGLMLSSEFVRLNGGTLEVRSLTGSGSIFSVTFKGHQEIR